MGVCAGPCTWESLGTQNHLPPLRWVSSLSIVYQLGYTAWPARPRHNSVSLVLAVKAILELPLCLQGMWVTITKKFYALHSTVEVGVFIVTVFSLLWTDDKLSQYLAAPIWKQDWGQAQPPMLLVPAHRRQRLIDLLEFYTSQSYMRPPCLKQIKTNKNWD